MTQTLVRPSLIAFDEVSDVLFEALLTALGSFEEATFAANEIFTLIPADPTNWELRITFHADAYETASMIPADIAFSAKISTVAVRQMKVPDLWVSQRGWKIGQTLCTDALIGDGYTAVICIA
jgi:hypothetical protein